MTEPRFESRISGPTMLSWLKQDERGPRMVKCFQGTQGHGWGQKSLRHLQTLTLTSKGSLENLGGLGNSLPNALLWNDAGNVC